MKKMREPVREELMSVLFHPININKFKDWGLVLAI